jgi:hypothetical protein
MRLIQIFEQEVTEGTEGLRALFLLLPSDLLLKN